MIKKLKADGAISDLFHYRMSPSNCFLTCPAVRFFSLLRRPALRSLFFFKESIRENRKKQVVLPNEIKKKLEYLKKFLYYLNKKKRKNRKHNYTAQIFRKRGRYETTGNLIYYCLISCRSCTERVLLRTSDVTDCPYLLDLHRHRRDLSRRPEIAVI